MMEGRIWEIALWICAMAILPARCQDPWKTVYASYYQLEFFDSSVDFDTAEKLCTARSEKMIRMDNEEVRTKVYATIKNATTAEYFWIGASGTLREWRWLGETTPANTSFISWYINQPDNYGKVEHNLIVRKKDGKYGDIGKNLKIAGTICQRKIQDPWMTQTVSNYKLEFLNFTLNFDRAKQLCTARLGNLIRMDDDQVKLKVYETISSATVEFFWIGSTRQTEEWKWLEEITAMNKSFITWADGQPGKDGVKNYLVVRKSGKYIDVTKDFNNAGIICQIGNYCNVHPNTCQNEGKCSSSLTSPFFNCKCGSGYFGTTCGQKYCDAHPNTCQNGGKCSSTLASLFYTCGCSSAYFGTTCGQKYCDAHPNTCQNGGNCSSELSTPFYTCHCIEGYSGKTCGFPWKIEYVSDYKLEFFDTIANFRDAKRLCTSRSGTMIRMNNVRVRDKVYSTIMSATTVGYFWIGATGRLRVWRWLEETTDANTSFIVWGPFQPDNYKGRDDRLIVWKTAKYSDVTTDFNNAGTICQFGWYCKIHPDACQNGGICTSTLTSPFYTCQCRDGYFGLTCEQTYCDTHSNLCQHSGTCSFNSTSPFYTCHCSGGYFGLTCEQTYCDTHPNLCQHSGTCSFNSTSPFYTCQCSGGYFGLTCGQTYCDSNPCQNGGTCSYTSTSPYYTCNCIDGYYGNTCGSQYCEINLGKCRPAGNCSSMPRAPFYTCQCDEGYRGYDCITGATLFSGYRLETVLLSVTFDQAKSACKKSGEKLFEPRTAKMNNAIKTLLKSTYGHFIGLQYNATGEVNQWQWESNKKEATYTNWNIDFPKNPGTDRCVRIAGPSVKWENVACESHILNYACQKHLICDATVSPCLNGGRCSPSEEPPYYECFCTEGYYMQNCSAYLKVTSQGNITSVAGDELLLIQATVVATENKTNVFLYKNSHQIKSVSNFESNTTVEFQLNWVNKTTAGNYIISAKPISREFTANVSFTITVHEKVKIEELRPKFIFSPLTNGIDRVVCRAMGNPTPTVSWYRGTSPVHSAVRPTGVYQLRESQITCLYVRNAKLSDNGMYICKATNKVGIKKTSFTANDSAFLAVYGKPTIKNVTPRSCNANGSAEVLWRPNNQTTSVTHRLTVQTLKPTISENATHWTVNNKVLLDNLLPSTNYKLQITVCPDLCISKLYSTTEFTTGVGLPGKLHNPVLSDNDNPSVCTVTWEWPTTTPAEHILHVEITWKASMVFASKDSMENRKRNIATKNVTSPVRENNVSTVPNRNYSVSLRAVTCAGPGNMVIANGICLKEPEAPTVVNKPTISDELTSDGFRKFQMVLPDESNGIVSCILVVVTKGDSSTMSKTINEESLRRASFSTVNKKPRAGESYIAIAIPRANFTGSAYSSKFGDNTTSYCEPAGAGETIQTRRKRRDETGLWGKNWPLHESSIYRYFTVTTTPTSSGHIRFGRSEAAFFENRSPFQYTLMLILIAVAVIIICVSAIGYYHYRHCDKRDIEKRSEEQTTYENIVLNELNSETAIPLPTLLDVYKTMKADSSLKFRDEFQKLKLQAKAVMTPATVAGSEEMMMKNRYKNILPFDATRVTLQGEGYDSYINACRIKGKDKNFIATQGPLSITVGDFWKMIIENKIKIIVMLAKCREAGKHKCAKYWPDVGKDVQHAKVKIENADEQYFGGYVKRTFEIFTPQQVRLSVLQFQFLNWPDHGVPATTSSFFRLHRAVMETHQELGNDIPLLVHCSAGVGRTGTFIGYDILLHESTQKKCADVFACVLDMRKQRVEMVQTSTQYELLHKLMLENYMFGQTDISKDDLAKMQLETGPDRIRLQNEFQNLSAAEPLNAHMDGNGEEGVFRRVVIVRQREDPEWISIDASSVEAFDNTNLIAAHGPFKSTIEYFWRAVLDNNVGTIVMLNRVDEEIEDPQTCTVKYWPDSNVKPVKFNNVSVQMLDEQLSDNVWTRNLLVSKKNQPEKKITHYQYLGWPAGGVPRNTAKTIDLVSKIPRVNGMEKPGAVLIHCIDGIGRTGAFCTILNVIARMKIENHIDVFRAVKDLRDCRPGMVKTLEEYTFCYKAAQAYLEANNTYKEVSLDPDEQRDEQQIYENLK